MHQYTINVSNLTYEQRLPLISHLQRINEPILDSSMLLKPIICKGNCVVKFNAEEEVWWVPTLFPNVGIALSISEFIQKTTKHTFKEL